MTFSTLVLSSCEGHSTCYVPLACLLLLPVGWCEERDRGRGRTIEIKSIRATIPSTVTSMTSNSSSSPSGTSVRGIETSPKCASRNIRNLLNSSSIASDEVWPSVSAVVATASELWLCECEWVWGVDVTIRSVLHAVTAESGSRTHVSRWLDWYRYPSTTPDRNRQSCRYSYWRSIAIPQRS